MTSDSDSKMHEQRSIIWHPKQQILIMGFCLIIIVSIILVIFEMGFWLTEYPAHPSSLEPFQVDAVVFIILGSYAGHPIGDMALEALHRGGQKEQGQRGGGWHGLVFVLTDRPACFQQAADLHFTQVIEVPSQTSAIKIKAIKTEIFSYLPKDIETVMYLDSDVVVTQPLDNFLSDLALAEHSWTAQHFGKHWEMAMFPDRESHTFGVCLKCNEWHTGVMIMKRGPSNSCLKAWGQELNSKTYGRDQHAFEQVRASGACKDILSLPAGHLLFMKDLLSVAVLPNLRTFAHYTRAAVLNGTDGIMDKIDHLVYDHTASALNLHTSMKHKNEC